MAADRVDDTEDLYRRILFGTNHYIVVQGRARLTSQAFADRKAKPSVDRVILRGNDPTGTQDGERNAVVCLETRAVRAIADVVRADKNGQPLERHLVDVVPAPVPGNDAHAEIVCAPELATLSKNPGRRLLEALVRLANDKWVIPPYELRPSPA